MTTIASRLPVTSVTSLGNEILFAQGRRLLSLENALSTNSNVGSQSVNPSVRQSVDFDIFQIDVCHCCGTIVLSGGLALVVLKSHSAQRDEASSVSLPTLSVSHWIVASRIECKANRLQLLLANNIVQTLSIEPLSVLATARALDPCLLYSGRFIELSGHLCAAGGTVYNHISVWRVGQPGDSVRLTAHKGIVFDMDYSSAEALLCAASDDRSITIWPLDKWPLADGELLRPRARMYGHEARVWRVRFCAQRLVSVGEDCCLFIWSLDARPLAVVKAHSGRNIWSLHLPPVSPGLVLTGGNDGALKLWTLADIIGQPLDIVRTLVAFPAALVHVTFVLFTPYGLVVGASDGTLQLFNIDQLHTDVNNESTVLAKSYAKLSERDICSIGHHSAVHEDSKAAGLADSDKMFHRADLTSANVPLATIVDESYVKYHAACLALPNALALGNLSGLLSVYTITSQQISLAHRHQLCVKSKVFSVFQLRYPEFSTCDLSGAIGICCDNGQSSVAVVNSSHQLQLIGEFVMPLSKQRWATAGVLMSAQVLIVGDRCGSVHLFRAQLPAFAVGVCQFALVHTLRGLHGNHGVSSVGFPADAAQSWHVYSTGRDGTERRLHVTDNALHCMEQRRLWSKADWLERLVDGRLAVCFAANSLAVYSVEDELVLWRVDSGGCHRPWDFLRTQLNDAPIMHFAFAQGGRVQLAQRRMPTPCRLLVPPAHGRHYNDVIVHRLSENWAHSGSTYNALLITASDDVRIGLTLLCTTAGLLSSSWYLCGHSSAVRCLAAMSRSADDAVYVASGGGRAELYVWLLHVRERVEHRLLGSAKVCGQRRRRRTSDGVPWDEAETRVMAVSLCRPPSPPSDQSPLSLWIGCGCSDGFVRLFGLLSSPRANQSPVIPLAHHYVGRCVLTLKLIAVADAVVLVAADSVGSIHLLLINNDNHYELIELNCLLVVTGVHQSGINDMAIVVESFNGDSQPVTIWSCGDDTAVAMTTLLWSKRCEQPRAMRLLRTRCFRSCHSAQISALQHICNGQLCTASVDGRLRCWTYAAESGCELTDAERTSTAGEAPAGCARYTLRSQLCVGISVSDVSALQLLRPTSTRVSHQYVVCLVGDGLQVLDIQLLVVSSCQSFTVTAL